MVTKTLYIPIEIFDRELGGALLLAANAAKRGWVVVLGGKQAIFSNMTRFSDAPGIFFLKSIVPGELFKQQEIFMYGHRNVSLDVEGLVPSNGEAGVRLRYSAESINSCDLLFFWGEEHYRSVASVYPQIQGRSHITGSPIVDEIIIRSAKRTSPASLLHKKILIGTSCGFANHINGIDFSKQMRKNAYSTNLKDADEFELALEADLDLTVFEYWRKVVPLIASNFIDCDVVLRPHPSENVEYWKEYLKHFKNVRIDSGQPILEELLDASVYIHFNSTSAITAKILGIPVLMPMPNLSEDLLSRVTYVADFSVLAETPTTIVDLIAATLINQNDSVLDLPLKKSLSLYCKNLELGAKPAYEAILDKLEDEYSFESKPFFLKKQSHDEKVITFLRKIKFFLLWSISILCVSFGIKPMKYLPPVNSYKNSRSKQPILNINKLRLLMNNLINHSDMKRLRVEKISTNLFKIDCLDS